MDNRLEFLFCGSERRYGIDAWGVVDRKSHKVALASTDRPDYVLRSINKGWLRLNDVQVSSGNEAAGGCAGLADLLDRITS